jgi:hypothetical protein
MVNWISTSEERSASRHEGFLGGGGGRRARGQIWINWRYDAIECRPGPESDISYLSITLVTYIPYEVQDIQHR